MDRKGCPNSYPGLLSFENTEKGREEGRSKLAIQLVKTPPTPLPPDTTHTLNIQPIRNWLKIMAIHPYKIMLGAATKM